MDTTMTHYADLRDQTQAKAPQSIAMQRQDIWQQPHMEPMPLDIPKSAIGMRTHPKLGPVKSDGGSSSYYDFTIHSSYGGSLKVKTGDVIRAMVGNDFDLGNIIKACRRVSEAMRGRGKVGTGVEYDLTKIAYFAEELKAAITPAKTETPVQPNECWEEVNAKLEGEAKEAAKEKEPEVYICGGQRYLVVPHGRCRDCAFDERATLCRAAPCTASARDDSRSVMFIKEEAK